jgi:hypothetical protein
MPASLTYSSMRSDPGRTSIPSSWSVCLSASSLVITDFPCIKTLASRSRASVCLGFACAPLSEYMSRCAKRCAKCCASCEMKRDKVDLSRDRAVSSRGSDWVRIQVDAIERCKSFWNDYNDDARECGYCWGMWDVWNRVSISTRDWQRAVTKTLKRGFLNVFDFGRRYLCTR